MENKESAFRRVELIEGTPLARPVQYYEITMSWLMQPVALFVLLLDVMIAYLSLCEAPCFGIIASAAMLVHIYMYWQLVLKPVYQLTWTEWRKSVLHKTLDNWDECIEILGRLPNQAVLDKLVLKHGSAACYVTTRASRVEADLALNVEAFKDDNRLLVDADWWENFQYTSIQVDLLKDHLKWLESEVEVALLKQSPIGAVAQDERKPLSERQRAKQRAKIARNQHIDNWHKR